jgi:hypothetical protein
MPDSPPILSFDLPDGRGKRSFETIDEFEKWLGKENAWWNKLGGGLQGQNNEIHKTVASFLRRRQREHSDHQSTWRCRPNTEKPSGIGHPECVKSKL